MACFKNITYLLAVCVLIAAVTAQSSQGGPHVSQGGPHQNQGRVRRQAEQNADDRNQGMPVWTTCDFTTTPAISCADCNTRLICKPVGGLLRNCGNPLRPYCNNGICSSVPATGC